MTPERAANQAGRGARQYGNPEGRNIDLIVVAECTHKKSRPKDKNKIQGIQETGKEPQKAKLEASKRRRLKEGKW